MLLQVLCILLVGKIHAVDYKDLAVGSDQGITYLSVYKWKGGIEHCDLHWFKLKKNQLL